MSYFWPILLKNLELNSETTRVHQLVNQVTKVPKMMFNILSRTQIELNLLKLQV